MAAAQDQPGGGDHAIGALSAGEARVLLDAVERDFGGAAKYRKHRAVFQKIDGVIAPLAGSDHAAIEAQDAVEFAAVAGDAAPRLVSWGDPRKFRRKLPPAVLA